MSEVMKLIQERHSARIPFDRDRPIAAEEMRQILEAARWAPTAHNMQNFSIVVVDDRQLLEAIASIGFEVSETFVRENYEQLSFSDEELRQKQVGILGTMFPPSWRTPGAKLEPSERQSAFQGRAVRESAALLVVVCDPSQRAPASEGDFLGIISLGCVLENMWLAAEALGIGFHVVSALAAEGVADEVQRLLGIPGNLRIAFAVRLGYPLIRPPYLRVRRDLERFVHHNRYLAIGKARGDRSHAP